MNGDYYKLLLEHSPVGYAYHQIICDANGVPCDYTFVEINEAFEKLTGLKGADILGKAVTEVLPGIRTQAFDWVGYYGEVALTGGEKEFEQYAESLDKWYRVNVLSPQRGYFATYFVDISKERTQFDEINNFFNVNLDLLCIADTDGNFLKTNKEWERVLGYTNEELNRSKFLDFVHPEDLEATLMAVSALIEQKQVLDFVNRFVCKDGSFRWIEWRSQPKGKLIYAAARDITEKRIVEMERARQTGLITSLFDSIPDIIAVQDTKGFFIECNPEFCKYLGKPKEEIIGSHASKWFGGEPSAFSQMHNPTSPGSGSTEHQEALLVYPEGSEMRVDVIRTPYRAEDGSILGTLFIGRDITQLKNAETELRASEEKHRLLAENTPDVIWVMNMQTMRYVYFSPSILQLRGYTVEEALAQSFEDSMTPESAKYLLENEEKVQSVKAFIEDPERSGLQIHEIQQPCKNGEIIWVETSTRLRYNANHEVEVVGVSRNIEARKKAEQQVLYLSYRDQLTGLYNRRFIEEEIKRLDSPRNLPISIILGDIDTLKLVNDHYGHEQGDALIKTVANAIRSCSRPEDLVSRWGGDEFVVLLPKTSRSDADKIAERINASCESQVICDKQVSVSIGVGTKERAEEFIYDIIRQADDAMYRVKAAKKAQQAHR